MNLPLPLTDLTNCDREPIHAPGSIQPHGFLFVLEPGSWVIVGASTNVRDFFWREASALIGGSIEDVLQEPIGEALSRVSAHAEVNSRALFVGNINVGAGGESAAFTLVAHRSGENLILEGERSVDVPPLQVEQELQMFLGQMGAAESVEEQQRLAVTEVRRMTGFDRCLLYQFDADWNGTVVAEDRNEVLPSYLHQRFPASDIPKQARELYRRNRLRQIPANAYRPAPIVLRGGSASATSLDLSLSVLRTVSPIHLEYMRNMGTGSSMSIAVLDGEELWGLIACHSLQPRWIPYATRAVCDLLCQFFGMQRSVREQARSLARRVELTGTMMRLLADMGNARIPINGARSEDLLKLAGASGVALVRGKQLVLHGRTPSATQVSALAAWVAEKNKSLLFWQNLATDYPPGKEFGDVGSGLLALTLDESSFTAILWFRPELINVVEWGGEPRKAIETDGEGRELHPRKSFETWRQTVRGSSVPWEPAVISVIADLRHAFRSTILRATVERESS